MIFPAVTCSNLTPNYIKWLNENINIFSFEYIVKWINFKLL